MSNGTPGKERMSIFRGTLLAVDGQFLCLGELGHLLWLDLTPKGYKELARTRLFPARETWSLAGAEPRTPLHQPAFEGLRAKYSAAAALL